MKKNKSFIIRNLIVSAALSLILILIFLVLFRPVYETNDDSGLATFTSGVKGVYDGHMVYVGYVLGAIEAFLYRVIPKLPIHPLLLYLYQFLAFTGISYVILTKKKNRGIVFISAASLFYFIFELFIKLQYTKTAGFVTASGVLLILFAADKPKKHLFSFISGLLLALIGFCLRPVQFVAEVGILSSIGVFILLGLWKDKAEKVLLVLIRYASALAILFAGCFLLWFADRQAYADSQWQDYLEYNKYRTELYDYGFPSYKNHQDAYEALGIDKDTYKLYKAWNFSDTELFTTDILKQIVSLKKERTINKELIKGFLKEIPIGIVKTPSFLCFALLFFCWLLFYRHSVKDLLTVLYLIMIIVLLYAYLYYKGRYLFNRVDVGIWYAASLVMLMVMLEGTARKALLCTIFSCFMVIAILFANSGVYTKYLRTGNTSDKQKKAERRMVYQTINEDPEHLYIAKSGTSSLIKSYEMFERAPFNILANYYSLGGWPSLTPTYMDQLKRFDVSNPYGDMIDNEKVYLIDDDIDLTLSYFHSHYSEDVDAELVNTIGGHNVYRIYTQ